MRIEIGKETPEAIARLPENHPDGSRIGVNYADVMIQGIHADLADGRTVWCSGRGLLLTLAVGEDTGEALMRRLDHGPDLRTILHEGLREAALAGGFGFAVEDNVLYLDIPDA